MAAALGGERSAAIARELTKTFEEVRRGPLAELADAYRDQPPPKGEIVVLVAPPGDAASSAGEADRVLRSLLETNSVSAAAAEAAALTGRPRRELYARALALKGAAMAASAERVAAEERGRRAEALAAWLLRLKGYRVLDRRYRTPVGEIDLVVRRGRCVAFVEVKARGTIADAAEAVTATGRARIARAAALWLAAHPDAAGCDMRFDVIVAAPGRIPRHIASAFDAGGAA